MSKVNSIGKVRIRASYYQTEAKSEYLKQQMAQFVKADKTVIKAGQRFLPAEDNYISKARNIVNETKTGIINILKDENGNVLKKRLTPVGPDSRGWYFCDVADFQTVRDLFEIGKHKLENNRKLLAENWEAYVAEGKNLIGTLTDHFQYPSKEDFLNRCQISLSFRTGVQDFSESVLDQIGSEAAAQVRALQNQQREELEEANVLHFETLLDDLRDRIISLDDSLQKGKRIRSEKFVSLTSDLESIKDESLLPNTNPTKQRIDVAVDSILAKLGPAERLPDLTAEERKAKANELRDTAVNAAKIASSVGL
jgi:hypothetical protein